LQPLQEQSNKAELALNNPEAREAGEVASPFRFLSISWSLGEGLIHPRCVLDYF
jgi:hypothetical protein